MSHPYRLVLWFMILILLISLGFICNRGRGLLLLMQLEMGFLFFIIELIGSTKSSPSYLILNMVSMVWAVVLAAMGLSTLLRMARITNGDFLLPSSLTPSLGGL